MFIFDKNHINSSFKEDDIEFKFTKNSGPGGQARNKLETCVVAKHKPTGLTCRISTRSQAKSKSLAIETLRNKVNKKHKEEEFEKLEEDRRSKIGVTVGRGDKRRTYREKDNQVVDHITGQTWKYKKWIKGQW